MFDPIESGANEIIRRCADDAFGEIVGLNQEEPVERIGRHLLVDDLEHLTGRDDVQQSEPPDPLWMILGEAMRDAGAAVMAHER